MFQLEKHLNDVKEIKMNILEEKNFFCNLCKSSKVHDFLQKKIFTVANNRRAICYYVDQFRRISFGNKRNIKEVSKKACTKR